MGPPIPGINIPIASPVFKGNELKYVTDAVSSGWVTSNGKYVKQFENMFEDYIGLPSAACTSGTAALHLALLSSGIGHGDEVIVPNLTFANTATVIIHVGAVPVLVDVKDDFCIDPELIERAITKNTKAIIPVHLYGNRCDMNKIIRISGKYNLKVIEDCCEAIDVNPIGDFGCYSFFANKSITTGEGGMVCGKDLETVKKYRDGGFDKDYYHTLPGLNYRMTNMQAALGCAQMENLGLLEEKRRRIICKYQDLPGQGKWLFVFETDDPEGTREYLKDHGIESRPVFYPLNLMPPFKNEADFPVSHRLWKTGVCIPSGPHLTIEEAEYIRIHCYIRTHFKEPLNVPSKLQRYPERRSQLD